MIVYYLIAERDLGRIVADADIDTLAPTLIWAGHLLFADRRGASPEAGAVRKMVTTVLAGVVGESRNHEPRSSKLDHSGIGGESSAWMWLQPATRPHSWRTGGPSHRFIMSGKCRQEARSEAVEACSTLSAFDKKAQPGFSEPQPGWTRVGRRNPGCFGSCRLGVQPRQPSPTHRPIAPTASPVPITPKWGQFALAFAILDAAEGNNPGNGISSPTDYSQSAGAYGSVGTLFEQTFGSSFPTLST